MTGPEFVKKAREVASSDDTKIIMVSTESDQEIINGVMADRYDAVDKVINMVMGSFKSCLMETTGDLEVSIPSVTSGRELENSLGENSVKLHVGVNIQDEYPAIISLLYREKHN